MTDALFALALAVVALFYSAVGQAGGTGYVAVMGLIGFDPATIKPTALALNVLVSAIGCYRFYRAGMLTWRTVYPFAVLGAPFSLLGGALHLPAAVYMPVVGVLLLVAGVLMLRSVKSASMLDQQAPVVPPFLPSLLVGGAIGLEVAGRRAVEAARLTVDDRLHDQPDLAAGRKGDELARRCGLAGCSGLRQHRLRADAGDRRVLPRHVRRHVGQQKHPWERSARGGGGVVSVDDAFGASGR